MKNKHITAMLLVGFLSLALAKSATAQEAASQKKETKQSAESTPNQYSAIPEPDVEKAGDRAKILLDKIEVLGSLAKPQAIFIIPGSDPQVDDIRIDRSFFMDIFRPVEKDFFPQRGRRKFRATIPW